MKEGQQRKRILVRDAVKIFGGDSGEALAMLDSGADKASILEKTGSVVGLNRVTFDVAEGEILVVMGLSGSGKSTMLRCINRLVEPTSGSIVVDDVEVTKLSSRDLLDFRRKTFGMVFQHFALFPNRTILDNVGYGLEIQRVAKAERMAKAMRAIETVGLAGWERKFPAQLSGGMQQRAGLARALAADVDILLMDEAFSALDPLIRRDMQRELRALQQKIGKTIVFVSHDLDEAIALGGRIVLMKDGAIVQIGWPEEILLNPATTYVRRFVENIDQASVVTAGRVAHAQTTLTPGSRLEAVRAALAQEKDGVALVTSEDGRTFGCVTVSALDAAPASAATLADIKLDDIALLPGTATLKEALPSLAASRFGLAVTNGDGALIGRLTNHDAISALARAERSAGAA